MSGKLDNVLAADDIPMPADGLSRRLAGRYILVLAVVAGLIVVDQVIVQPLTVRLSWYAPVINVAGRQRMLSQKLTKVALILQATDDRAERRSGRDELQETLVQWTQACAALRDGSQSLGIQRIQSPEIERKWNHLSPHFDAMCDAAGQIIREGNASDRDRLVAATKTIVDHEAAFLASMERIVKLMENEAAAEVFRLRFCAATISAAVILLLLALGWFVIRPATSTIRRQIDELESRVAARTRELSAALTALRHEVTERKQSEFRTQRLSAQLAHTSRVWTMGHLTAGLAHELNQPLATIANYAEACDVELARFENNLQSERLRTYLDRTKLAALRAGQIFHRMRDFVRPNTPAATEVEINSLILDVFELCRSEIDNAGTEVALELTDDHATVCVEPVQIQQVLVNLLQNAIQAMRERPIQQRRIDIRTSVEIDSVQVNVSDSGPGFTVADSEEVFAPFYTTKRDGLGIGLSICREIVDAHGGTIWAEAQSGRGAKFSFTLPLAQNDAGSRRAQTQCVCC